MVRRVLTAEEVVLDERGETQSKEAGLCLAKRKEILQDVLNENVSVADEDFIELVTEDEKEAFGLNQRESSEGSTKSLFIVGTLVSVYILEQGVCTWLAAASVGMCTRATGVDLGMFVFASMLVGFVLVQAVLWLLAAAVVVMMERSSYGMRSLKLSLVELRYGCGVVRRSATGSAKGGVFVQKGEIRWVLQNLMDKGSRTLFIK